MKNKIFLLFIIVFSYFLTKGQTIQWPVNQPANTQGRIVGTVGEFRPPSTTHPNGRFHMGTDITGNNTNVYAINAGTIIRVEDGVNSYLLINNVYYYHARPTETISDALDVGQTVTVKIGDEIGTMLEQTNVHVHLENSTTNYKAQHLSPYIDNVSAAPYFSLNFINNGVQFYRNPILRSTPVANLPTLVLNQQVTVEGVQYTKLYSKVDIAVHAIEPQTLSSGASGGGQCAPNRISWVLRNANNQDLIVNNSFDFTSMPVNDANHINACFHPQSAGNSNPTINIITASPNQTTYDRYFNTGLRTNTTDTWPNNTTLDAHYNGDAQYPDGKYQIIIRASDVSFASNPQNTTPDADKTVNVLLDNFRPYIQKVEIKSGATDIYKGEWVWNPAILPNGAIEYRAKDNANLHNPQDGIIAKAARDKNITIKVTASEPLNALNIIGVVPTLQAKALTLTCPMVGRKLDTEGKEWEFIINASALKTDGSTDGIHIIRFNGNDLAGNVIENFSPAKTSYLESEIPKHIGVDNWSPDFNISRGYDDVHSFEIGGEGGTTNSFSVTINANKSAVEVNEDVVFSTVILDPNAVPDNYSYHWMFFDDKSPFPIKEYSGGKTATERFTVPSAITAEVTLSKDGVNEGYGKKQNIVTVGNALLVDIIVDKEKAVKNEEIIVTASASGATGGFTYEWFFLNECSLNYSSNKSETISYSGTGTKTIQLTVRSGQIYKTIRKTITIVENPPLDVDFYVGVDPESRTYTLKPNLPVQFKSIVENAVGNVTYYWDFGDGTPPTWSSTRTLAWPSHEYLAEGNYTVSLTVKDNNSRVTVQYMYRVSDLGSLIVNFTAIPNATDQTVRFDMYANGSNYCKLNFGDGQESTPFSAGYDPYPKTQEYHTYSVGGTYTVTLYAWVEFWKAWKIADQKTVYVYTEPHVPNGIIYAGYEYFSSEYPFRLSAYPVNVTPFNDIQGYLSQDSPWYYMDGHWGSYALSYRHKWWSNSGVEFSHPNEPFTWIFPSQEIQDELDRNGTYNIAVTIDITGRDETCTRTFVCTLYKPIKISMNRFYTNEIGNTVTVSAQITGGVNSYDITWYTGSTPIKDTRTVDIIVGDITKKYTINVRNKETSNDLYHVNREFYVVPTLKVDAGNNIYLCNDGSEKSFNPIISGGEKTYYYRWEPNENISHSLVKNPFVTSSGVGTKTYTLTVKDWFGLTASDQVDVITYNDIIINLDPFYYVNGYESSTISPTILNGSGDFSYSWANGAKTKDITVNYQSSFEQVLTIKDNKTGCIKTAGCKILCRSANITSENIFRRSKNPSTIKTKFTSIPGIISYKVHADCQWLTVTSGVEGYTGNDITFNVSANNTNDDRVGKLVIESPEALNSPYNITIIQSKDNIINVPSDFGTIQEAINAASDGDKLEVDEGTYYENILFEGTKKISVKATGCPENTIIQSTTNNKPVVSFKTNNSILQGFTITKGNNPLTTQPGSGEGGGIRIKSSSPELYDLIITENLASDGGGIYMSNSTPKITNVIIQHNQSVDGGGVYIFEGLPTASKIVLLTNVLITNNKSYTSNPGVFNMLGTGGGVFCGGNATLDNVTISNNTYNSLHSSAQGSITVQASGSLILRNCIITDDIASTAGTLTISFSDVNSAIKGPIVVTWGTGSIKSNPLLDGNYKLLATSPCINSGSLTKLDKDGSRCDMGYTGGKGIYNTSATVCTKGFIFALAPRFLEVGANCSPLLSYGAGESDNFVATQQITLKSGFEGKTGSALSFKIRSNYNEPFQYDDKCTVLKSAENLIDTTKIFNKYPEDAKSDKKDFNFNAFPNPTEGVIQLFLINSTENICSVELLNVLGVTIKGGTITNSSGEFDISEFKPGSYFIKITSGYNVKTKMIIKQ